MQLQTLPIGEQSFEKIRKLNRVYVDKTEYLYKLTQEGTHYFLSRPRRFGKSLFLSTLEAYFLGQRELFHGLFIETKEKDWAVHPVFHFDFNPQSYTSESDLFAIINDYLWEFERVYGSNPSETDLGLRFKGLIQRAYQQTGQRVVVLIDEYDKPLLQALGNPELQEAYRKMLRGFYGVLKSMDQYIRLSFLTGITKFSKISIFSDLNNLNDISRDRRYASICGLTDEEVDKNLAPHIQRFAEQKGKSYDELRADLKRMYDGYYFVDSTPGLYNPFSVLCAMSKMELGSYWFETGTPTMLVEMLQRKHFPLPALEEAIDAEALDSKDGNFDNIVPLLYQSGYMSILRCDEEQQLYWLTFPNEEVRKGFFHFLLPYYAAVQKTRTIAAILDFLDDINNGKVEQFLQRLTSLFANFPYDAQKESYTEEHFRNVLYVLCVLLGMKVDAEYRTSDGRIDLLITTDKFRYVIECKIDSTPAVALKQIHDKQYGLSWTLDEKETILIGLNFSTTSRRPDAWIIERQDGTISESGTKSGMKNGMKSGPRKVDHKSGPDSEKSGPQKWTKRSANREAIEAQIISLMAENPRITTRLLAQMMGRARSGLSKHLDRMQIDGLIKFDSSEGGKWIVLK